MRFSPAREEQSNVCALRRKPQGVLPRARGAIPFAKTVQLCYSMAMHLPPWVSDELDRLDFQFGKVELTIHQGQVVRLNVERRELIKGCRRFLEPETSG